MVRMMRAWCGEGMNALPLQNPACPTSGCTKLGDSGRLAAVHATGMLWSPPEAAFDRFTQLATRLLATPISAITLIDRDMLFIKSQIGLDEPLASRRSKPVGETFCQYIVDTVEPLVIHDTRLDERISDFDLVKGGALAYLAIPLISADGHTLGTFCVIDGQPRRWSEDDIATMSNLASSVMSEIELRMLSCRLLEQYNDLRALELQREDMLQMLVHDLRNPLTSLLAGLDLLGCMSPLDDLQQQALSVAQRGGDALLKLVNEILDVSKCEAGQLSLQCAEVAPEALMADAVEQVRYLAAGASVRLTATASAVGLGTVSLDADKIRRVLINLLANAIQHTPAGGEVSLAALKRPDQGLELRVSDNGLGIPTDQISHIFDKFSSLHLSRILGASSGLGLAFCKQVVQAHGGDIDVESTLGRGSIFRVVLPG